MAYVKGKGSKGLRKDISLTAEDIMVFLITGAAGFIGGNYCHIMTKKYPNDMFIGFDALTYAGNIKTLAPVMERDNFRFVKGDISSKEDVKEVFDNYKIDIVINFAAESHVDRSLDNPLLFVKTNVDGVALLLSEALQRGVKRFHQVSTDEVYGDLPLNRPDLLFNEDCPLKASSPYSASKASADLIVMSYYRSFNAPVTISRCSNNYGPYQFPEKLIPLMIKNARSGKKLPVYGDGLNVRDWLYVADHCTAIDTIVRNSENGKIYNIGGNSEKNNITIVKTILNILGKGEDLIEFVADRKGHDRRYAIDASKIKAELGWEREYKFDDAIKATVEWYVKNDKWLSEIESGEYLRFMRSHYGE